LLGYMTKVNPNSQTQNFSFFGFEIWGFLGDLGFGFILSPQTSSEGQRPERTHTSYLLNYTSVQIHYPI